MKQRKPLKKIKDGRIEFETWDTPEATARLEREAAEIERKLTEFVELTARIAQQMAAEAVQWASEQTGFGDLRLDSEGAVIVEVRLPLGEEGEKPTFEFEIETEFQMLADDAEDDAECAAYARHVVDRLRPLIDKLDEAATKGMNK